MIGEKDTCECGITLGYTYEIDGLSMIGTVPVAAWSPMESGISLTKRRTLIVLGDVGADGLVNASPLRLGGMTTHSTLLHLSGGHDGRAATSHSAHGGQHHLRRCCLVSFKESVRPTKKRFTWKKARELSCFALPTPTDSGPVLTFWRACLHDRAAVAEQKESPRRCRSTSLLPSLVRRGFRVSPSRPISPLCQRIFN
jgi:hypothetical protein